jgi:hypothetical protein
MTIITVMMETGMVPETLQNCNHLKWLMAREDFIKIMMSAYGRTLLYNQTERP